MKQIKENELRLLNANELIEIWNYSIASASSKRKSNYLRTIKDCLNAIGINASKLDSLGYCCLNARGIVESKSVFLDIKLIDEDGNSKSIIAEEVYEIPRILKEIYFSKLISTDSAASYYFDVSDTNRSFQVVVINDDFEVESVVIAIGSRFKIFRHSIYGKRFLVLPFNVKSECRVMPNSQIKFQNHII